VNENKSSENSDASLCRLREVNLSIAICKPSNIHEI
jgi:hypothetical protein